MMKLKQPPIEPVPEEEAKKQVIILPSVVDLKIIDKFAQTPPKDKDQTKLLIDATTRVAGLVTAGAFNQEMVGSYRQETRNKEIFEIGAPSQLKKSYQVKPTEDVNAYLQATDSTFHMGAKFEEYMKKYYLPRALRMIHQVFPMVQEASNDSKSEDQQVVRKQGGYRAIFTSRGNDLSMILTREQQSKQTAQKEAIKTFRISIIDITKGGAVEISEEGKVDMAVNVKPDEIGGTIGLKTSIAEFYVTAAIKESENKYGAGVTTHGVSYEIEAIKSEREKRGEFKVGFKFGGPKKTEVKETAIEFSSAFVEIARTAANGKTINSGNVNEVIAKMEEQKFSEADIAALKTLVKDGFNVRIRSSDLLVSNKMQIAPIA